MEQISVLNSIDVFNDMLCELTFIKLKQQKYFESLVYILDNFSPILIYFSPIGKII